MDHRPGVRHLLAAGPHRHLLIAASGARGRVKADPGALFAFDRECGSPRVAGADEAGRGCLAGPLVAAGVLFDCEAVAGAETGVFALLNDSKQIKPADREALFPCILEAANQVSIVIRGAPGIDRRGLHVTNLEALSDALVNLLPEGAACLVDGFSLPGCPVEHRAVVKGDATSAAIAAASVIAKVTRDRYMRRAAETYPGWGFEDHVGYATATHRRAIQELGITPLHRRSFRSAAYAQLELTG